VSFLSRPREKNFSSSSEKTRPPVFLAFGESARAEISATKRRGNRVGVFVKFFFRQSCGVSVWKKTAQTVTNYLRIRDVQL